MPYHPPYAPLTSNSLGRVIKNLLSRLGGPTSFFLELTAPGLKAQQQVPLSPVLGLQKPAQIKPVNQLRLQKLFSLLHCNIYWPKCFTGHQRSPTIHSCFSVTLVIGSSFLALELILSSSFMITSLHPASTSSVSPTPSTPQPRLKSPGALVLLTSLNLAVVTSTSPTLALVASTFSHCSCGHPDQNLLQFWDHGLPSCQYHWDPGGWTKIQGQRSGVTD